MSPYSPDFSGQHALPIGTTPQSSPAAQTAAARWTAGIIAAVCWSMLVIAACLHPRLSGMGTHQELGLPACGFLARTGWPCPSCGLTTSVTATVHGRFALAFHAQPFGLILTVVAAVLAMAGTYQAAVGRIVLPSARGALIAVMAGIVLLLAGWGLKMFLGAASGEFPLH